MMIYTFEAFNKERILLQFEAELSSSNRGNPEFIFDNL